MFPKQLHEGFKVQCGCVHRGQYHPIHLMIACVEYQNIEIATCEPTKKLTNKEKKLIAQTLKTETGST